MSDELQRYLDVFVAKASADGLPIRKPGSNWVPLQPLVRGSHVSLSVARNQIQVNLNVEDDAERLKFDQLYRDRVSVEGEVGEGLTWEKKDGRKKTAIRATMASGYDNHDWDAQHDWAIAMMKAFQRSFEARLG
jgi:hypothetical protein